MFSKMGAKAFKADLKNITALCRFLHNPQQQIRSIHIAGTNGKGSVSNMLAAVFSEHGYKTALYTSPHLKSFRERIKINGEMIPENFVVSFIEKTKIIAREIEPSFFELTFAMALDYFACEKTDIAIIETGLGGRLDSTNIILPVLSVITNIGYDHMDLLGDTLEKIAFEKAGIIKNKIPVVIGESLPATRAVFLEQAKKMEAPVYFAEEEYTACLHQYQPDFQDIEVSNLRTQEKEIYRLDLNGLYQHKNLITVLAALEWLRPHFLLEKQKIKEALAGVKKRTGFFGRWEVIRTNPTIVLDVAHNADGIRMLLKQASLLPCYRLHIIIGMVKDKDTNAVLEQLPREAVYYFTNAHIPRALPAADLQKAASAYNLQGRIYADVNLALQDALAHADKDDLVMVCGSVFLIAEVRITSHER